MKRPVSRRDFLRIAAAVGATAAGSTSLHSTQTMSAPLIGKSEPSWPSVFWVTDGVETGDLIMAVGGGGAELMRQGFGGWRTDPPDNRVRACPLRDCAARCAFAGFLKVPELNSIWEGLWLQAPGGSRQKQ